MSSGLSNFRRETRRFTVTKGASGVGMVLLRGTETDTVFVADDEDDEDNWIVAGLGAASIPREFTKVDESSNVTVFCFFSGRTEEEEEEASAVGLAGGVPTFTLSSSSSGCVKEVVVDSDIIVVPFSTPALVDCDEDAEDEGKANEDGRAMPLSSVITSSASG